MTSLARRGSVSVPVPGSRSVPRWEEAEAEEGAKGGPAGASKVGMNQVKAREACPRRGTC